ncbi:FtsX-like permease family protein [Emticicia sp. CRIBPO]|uniref:ABC transporter permease n=1 Tax=Emticicia sp. CRIBPO TaxID=2683258 RepID=UPI0014126A29|nr:ABC transporter permease [Emticicia sp. CRIBPO]NBA85783.1 FtsX-like permease family protein [Emticicia sp. CRIBPO]
MIRNYLKIAWRNLSRAKGYAFINIAGLAVGMAAAVLIFLWIQSELSFDRFYEKTGRIYQVFNRDVINDEPFVWDSTPVPLAPVLKQEYADIEDAVRYKPVHLLFSANEKHLTNRGAFVDPGFADIFDLKFSAGHKTSALGSLDGIVITRSLAEKMFGTADALGKTLQIEHKDNFTVSGVIEDIPDNSQFAGIDYFLPWNYLMTLGWSEMDHWNSNNYYTYVLLKEKADADAVSQKIKKTTASRLTHILDNPANREIFLFPANKWHLYSKVENGQLVDGKIITVRLFGLIAIFILLIACVNFVNLSTARSEKRAKEVGIRKVAGAQKSSLIFQFISESVLLAFFAGLIALLIVSLCIPAFNNLVDKRLSLNIGSSLFWLSGLGFVLLTGLLAGAYPAFYLSGFQPVKVMKGTFKNVKAAFSPRKGLVVMQFTFAILLIISTLVINRQIDYGQNRSNGYDKSNLIFTYLSGDLAKNLTALRQELENSGAVVSVSKSMGPITQLNTRQWGLSWPGSTQKDKDQEFVLFAADKDFVKTNGVTLAAGRELDVTKYPTDSTGVVLNEAAVKAMRLKDPVGTTIKYNRLDRHIVGVVKDFIYASPYESVNPVIIEGPGSPVSHMWASVRLNPGNTTAQNLAIAEKIYKKYNPGYPFDYSFADDSYKAKFADEQRTASLTGIFTALTIFISCLGLFGLAAFTAQQRTKEIGVRKVLGASVAGIVKLLSVDFLKLIFIAFVLASPVAWYAMNKWLEDYTYKISIGWSVFALTFVVSLVIVFLSTSFQAIRAALMNPVKSLKSE